MSGDLWTLFRTGCRARRCAGWMMPCRLRSYWWLTAYSTLLLSCRLRRQSAWDCSGSGCACILWSNACWSTYVRSRLMISSCAETRQSRTTAMESISGITGMVSSNLSRPLFGYPSLTTSLATASPTTTSAMTSPIQAGLLCWSGQADWCSFIFSLAARRLAVWLPHFCIRLLPVCMRPLEILSMVYSTQAYAQPVWATGVFEWPAIAGWRLSSALKVGSEVVIDQRDELLMLFLEVKFGGLATGMLARKPLAGTLFHALALE